MAPDLLYTLFVLLLTMALFLWGRLRSDLVAVLSLLALLLGGVISTDQALAGFSNPLVIMIAGLFVVGAGVFRTGLAQAAGEAVTRLVGDRPVLLLAALMALVAVLSAFMSNTGTVAVLMPVIVAVALRLGQSPSGYLMPVAFASSLGGMLTLIGTPPNLIAMQALQDAGAERLGFFSLTPIGLVAVLIGGAFMLLARSLLPQRQGPTTPQMQRPAELLRAYGMPEQVFLLRVPAGLAKNSPVLSQSLRELGWPARYGARVLKIEKAPPAAQLPAARLLNKVAKAGAGARLLKAATHEANAETKLKRGDLIWVEGEEESVRALGSEMGLEWRGQALTDGRKLTTKHLGVAQVLLPPDSRLLGRSIAELDWPARGLHIIGFRRGGKALAVTPEQRLAAADSLLVQGQWKRMEALSEDARNVVVIGAVGEQASLARARGKAPVAAALLLLMLLLMTLEVFSPVVAVWIAALGMVLTGCLRHMGEAYRQINWESVVLIAAMLPMATALQETGGVALVSGFLVDTLGGYGPLAVMAGFYLGTMLLSQFISNTATAVLFAPIALSSAAALGVQPEPLVIAVAVAASMAFATPIASPPNALVMTAGGYKFSDYARLGLPLQLVLFAAMLLVIPLVFPFS